MTLADAALAYARQGWPVFRCRPRAKEPAASHGFQDATVDAEIVARWWRQTPHANIGFPPGRAGLIVLDYDHADGEAEARRLGALDAGLAVLTPRGRHLYFRHPGGPPIGNTKLHGLLDVRADRGYVMLPPSVHPSGHVYRWSGRIADVGPLPPAVLAALRPPEPPRAPVRPIPTGTSCAYIVAAIVRECEALAVATEGERNNALNRAAYSLARFVAAGEAHADAVEAALTVAARATGLPVREIERTIRSAFRARQVA